MSHAQPQDGMAGFLNDLNRQRRKTFSLSSLPAINENASYEVLLNESKKKRVETEEEVIETKIKEWICHVLNETQTNPKESFHEFLKDGTRLCRLLNIIYPGTIKRFYPNCKIPYKMLDNINQFLESRTLR
eukprot:TRINITY_DN7101_c0_g1_i1.p1 TRINITY_DN7101_c0_g1~~TRINITY_DN7101_c0_g1_i1.p1  ORF type:complete len:131 (-),score=34.88 TRINITY_DN7101_c0_g1_i1:4-396(-)